METLEYLNTPASPRVIGGRLRHMNGVVLHSTDGHWDGDLRTLRGMTDRKVSSHWLIGRDGRVAHMVDTGSVAYHAGVAIAGWGNADTNGIEMTHVDGHDDWPDAQVRSCAKLCAWYRLTKSPTLQFRSHAVIAQPYGRKQDPVAFPWTKFGELVHEFLEEGVQLREVEPSDQASLM